jgi:hypothetical protein
VFRSELLRRCSDSERGNFSESNLSGYGSGGVQQVRRAPQETGFFLAPAYSRDMQSTRPPRRTKSNTAEAKNAMREILLLEEIHG